MHRGGQMDIYTTTNVSIAYGYSKPFCQWFLVDGQLFQYNNHIHIFHTLPLLTDLALSVSPYYAPILYKPVFFIPAGPHFTRLWLPNIMVVTTSSVNTTLNLTVFKINAYGTKGRALSRSGSAQGHDLLPNRQLKCCGHSKYIYHPSWRNLIQQICRRRRGKGEQTRRQLGRSICHKSQPYSWSS